MYYKKAGILHRNVTGSVGNTMITKGGKGVLIDWEMCKRVGVDEETRRMDPGQQNTLYASELLYFRGLGLAAVLVTTRIFQGTREFIAARLSTPEEPPLYNLVVDLESFVHVLIWGALRSHRMPVASVAWLHNTKRISLIPNSTNHIWGGGPRAWARMVVLGLKDEDILVKEHY